MAMGPTLMSSRKTNDGALLMGPEVGLVIGAETSVLSATIVTVMNVIKRHNRGKGRKAIARRGTCLQGVPKI